MRLQDTIARLAEVTEAHGDALRAKGDHAGADRIFCIQEAADDLLKALTVDEQTEALVEDLMQFNIRNCELLAALSQAVDGAPHWRRNAQRVIEAASPARERVAA